MCIRDSADAAHIAQPARGDGDIVEQAEAHRAIAFRMMARGAHRDECVVDCAVEHGLASVSYTHLRAHETVLDIVCRLLLEKKKT